MYFWISCLCAGVCIGVFCRVFIGPLLGNSMPDSWPDQRALRSVWPWVLAVSILCRPIISWRMRQTLERAIRLAGIENSVWRAEHVVALQVLAALVAWTCVAGCLCALTSVRLSTGMSLGCLAGMIFAIWPRLVLRDKGARRQRAMLREFPFLLDMTTLCVEAGLNLNGALAQAAKHSPPGHLRQELRYMLADMRTGASRRDALAGLVRRTELPALQHLATALAQADQLGMSLGP